METRSTPAEDLPALYRRANRHHLLLVMIGWPLLPGLVRTVPVVVHGVGPQHGPQSEAQRALGRICGDLA